jgi:hypothetical protein
MHKLFNCHHLDGKSRDLQNKSIAIGGVKTQGRDQVWGRLYEARLA